MTEPRPDSGEFLQTLLAARNTERLVAEAKRFLSLDPRDFSAHYYAALGLVDLDRLGEAKSHLDILFAAEPDSAMTRFAAVRYYARQEKWSAVTEHALEGIRVSPDLAIFSTYAALADLRRLRFKQAREHIDRAKRLDPDDGGIADLHISIHGIEATSPADAVRRLEKYADALRLDPENDSLHHSMGRVCLDDLDDARTAEGHFREALRLDPSHSGYQRDLFEAVAKRSLVYRLFSIPTRTFHWMGNLGRVIALQPWRLLFLLIGFKACLGFFVWLFITTLLLWPGGKAYEWLLVSEIKSGSTLSEKRLRAWFWLRRWPRWLRFVLFLALNLTLWGALFALIGLPLSIGYGFVAIYVGVHFLMLTALSGLRHAGAARARRKLIRTKGDERVARVRD